MSELRELYQEVIIDHGRHPRHFGALAEFNFKKEGFNPLCGDQITLYIQEQQGVIVDIMFEGCGCAISMASASLMSEALKGKLISDAVMLFSDFHELVTKGDDNGRLGKLAVFSGVTEFPARVKCATLAWHTLKAALENSNETVSTEGAA